MQPDRSPSFVHGGQLAPKFAHILVFISWEQRNIHKTHLVCRVQDADWNAQKKRNNRCWYCILYQLWGCNLNYCLDRYCPLAWTSACPLFPSAVTIAITIASALPVAACLTPLLLLPVRSLALPHHHACHVRRPLYRIQVTSGRERIICRCQLC